MKSHTYIINFLPKGFFTVFHKLHLSTEAFFPGSDPYTGKPS